MAQRRTTLFLDVATREAADQLADLDDCSASEAIRRAVVEQRDRRLGVPAAIRRRRRETLERLFELFAGHDAAAEVRRLKAKDEAAPPVAVPPTSPSASPLPPKKRCC